MRIYLTADLFGLKYGYFLTDFLLYPATIYPVLLYVFTNKRTAHKTAIHKSSNAPLEMDTGSGGGGGIPRVTPTAIAPPKAKFHSLEAGDA